MDEHFVKLYGRGIDRIEGFLKGSAPGALWVYLARRVLNGVSAIVISREVLAAELGMSPRNVTRAIAALRELGAVEVRRVGNANCLIMNAEEVWKGAELRKHSVVVNALAVIGFGENEGLREAVSAALAQPELPGVVSSPVVAGVKVDA